MLKRPNRAILRPVISADYTDYADFGQGLNTVGVANYVVRKWVVSDRLLSMIQPQNEICVIREICGSFRLLGVVQERAVSNAQPRFRFQFAPQVIAGA
jgi:hypothetical protein